MSSKLFRNILIAKTLLIVVFVLSYNNYIFIGNKNSLAQEESANKKSNETSQQKSVAKAQKETLDGKKLVTLRTGDITEKSILDDLINLPEIDKEEITKQEVIRYLQIADRAKQSVSDKSKLLDDRIVRLKNIEQLIDNKLVKLEEEREFFLNSIQKEKEIQLDRVNALVSFYEKMEPKKAAPVFETMDKSLAVKLFKKLKKKQITAILEAMQDEKRTELTEFFGRVGSGEEYQILKEMNKSLTDAFNECKTPLSK